MPQDTHQAMKVMQMLLLLFLLRPLLLALALD
jgi:hypothetical protein